jgi:hypothetical protein
MSSISTLVEETRGSTTFVEKTPSSDPRIYTSAGELIYALDGSLVLRLLSLFLTKIKGFSPFLERG